MGGVVVCEKGIQGTIYQRDRIGSRKPLESIKSIQSYSVSAGVGGGAQECLHTRSRSARACKTLSTILGGRLAVWWVSKGGTRV